MPSVDFWNINSIPYIHIQNNTIAYASSNDIIIAKSLSSNASIELLRNGTVIASGIGSVSYILNSNLTSTWAAGKYNITASEPGSGIQNNSENITITKAMPLIKMNVSNTITSSMASIANYSITYSINSINDQLEAYLSVNGANVSSTNSITTYTMDVSNTTTFYAFTNGNANYTPLALNKSTVYITRYPYYVPITIYNNQSSNTPAPFQQLITLNMSKYSDYINGNLSNVFFFYSNKTIIPSWRESGLVGSTFNGAPAYLVQEKGYAWMNNAAQHFTMSIWVNPSSPNGVILDELNQSEGWHDAWLDLVNGNVYMKIWDMACVNLGPIPENQWSNIAIEYNGSTYSGYINGNFAGSGTGTRSVPGGSYTLFYALGKNDTTNCGSGSAFDGLMLNYQIYNTTLQPNSIAAIYSNGMYGVPPLNQSEGLNGWWPLKYNSSAAEGNDSLIYSNVNFTSTHSNYWLKLNNGIPADSNLTIYMGIANRSYMLFNKLTIGEAPQLSPTYAEYDNGANVFSYYENFAGTAVPQGWTTSGTISINNGLTISGGSSASQIESSATYGTSVLDWYGYATEPTDSGYWTNLGWYSGTSNGQGNSWFAYAGQSDYGYGYVSSNGGQTITYTSTATGTVPNHVFSIANNGATAYYSLDYSQQSTTYSMQTSHNNIAFRNGAGSSGGGSTVFVQWVRTRAYPPNGVMPSYNIGLTYAPSAPELIINKSTVQYGKADAITASSQISGEEVELSINGNVVAGPTSNTIKYSFPVKVPGVYTVNATNINNSKTTSLQITVVKATPQIKGPQQGFYINSYNSTYSISTTSNQLMGYLYINGVKVSSTNSSNSIKLTAKGSYTIVFNTTGNGNYTNATTGAITVNIINQSVPYKIPNSIYYYSIVHIHNSQSVPTIKQPQEYLQINESTFANYITYNYSNANFEFFSQNGTIIPSWIIDNVSGYIGVWLKL
ncbi:MAG: LamG-like jellyroll fold domain-containing protein, partial [Methanothrix sp.]